MPPPVKMPIRAVRDAYQAGSEAIRTIARRYGISHRAIRKPAPREAGPRLLTDRDVEETLLTEQDIDAMVITAEDLARMSVDPLFGQR